MAFGGRSQMKMSEETFDFVCNACEQVNKTTEAVKYCVECSGYCCQSCVEAHTMFPLLKNHNLMDVDQANQAMSQQSGSLPEFPTERCSIHKGKVVDMYCEEHDVVGCYVCIAKDHKSCKDSHIHSVPDMINTIIKLSNTKQTQTLLNDMVMSLQNHSKCKDTQLQSLVKAKEEALDKVQTYQKALEAFLRKAAESSKNEIETAFKELEMEILNEKISVDNISDDLQVTNDKLKQSEGNRAQCFVCTKIADEKLKAAEKVRSKQDLLQNTDIQLSFTENESLMDYMKDLNIIGHVAKHREQKYTRKLKHDLYKVKGSHDITIKISDDSKSCCSFGCCLTDDDKLLVTDFSHKKLKLIDIQKMSVVDYSTLDCNPNGVCCVNKHEVAVACKNENKIQFVSIQNKMTPTRQIKMSHCCYGIAFKDDKLYVTDHASNLYIYNMAGSLLKTISVDNAGNNLFQNSRHVTFNETGDRMFVGSGKNNGIVCFDVKGNYLSTLKDTDIKFADGVCVDGRGNIFVVGNDSNNVVQFNEDGKKLGVVLSKEDGLRSPFSLCFHPELKRMFVTLDNTDVLKMYVLE